jgi:hypothetical protein
MTTIMLARKAVTPPAAKPDHVCQLLIVVANTDPLVWRRIQVPET